MHYLLLLSLFSANIYALAPFEPLTAWDKSQVKVCWGTEHHQNQTFAFNEKEEFINYTAEQKAWIKGIVTREFTVASVGIEFVGWQNCPDKADAQIVLLRAEPPIPEDSATVFAEKGGRATIGMKGSQSNSFDASTNTARTTYESNTLPYLNYMILNTRGSNEKRMDQENYIKTIALHEFGHSAGLRHEHIRIADSKKDPNCKKMTAIKLNEEPAFESTRFAGPYDHNSIMNYCFINLLISNTGLTIKTKNIEKDIKLTDPTLFTSRVDGKKTIYNVKVGLSAGDKQALKCMYVSGEDKAKCNLPK
jgi:hypothetical protein